MKRGRIVNIALVLAVAHSLIACQSAQLSQSSRDAYAINDARYTHAQALFEQGQFAEALQQWRILILIYPGDSALKKLLIDTETVIDEQKQRLLNKLENAHLSTSERRKTKLQILALTPNDTDMKQRLRKENQRQALYLADNKTKRQIRRLLESLVQQNDELVQGKTKAKKSTKEAIAEVITEAIAKASTLLKTKQFARLLAQIELIKSLDDKHKSISHFSQSAYLGLANNSLKSGDLTLALNYMAKAQPFMNAESLATLQERELMLKKQKSEELQQAAQKVFNQDIGQAIRYLELALEYDATNKVAEQRLKHATKIQKNLTLIKRQ